MGCWLSAQRHDVHFLTGREQSGDFVRPDGLHFHDLSRHSASMLRSHVGSLGLDALLLNPERSGRYRGVAANVLRAGYGTDQYRQKIRSFRNPVERGLRNALRVTPWVSVQRRRERAFYERTTPCPEVIAQSAYMRSEILDCYRVPPDHIHVIHNAVDTSEFSPTRREDLRAEMRAKWSIEDDALCLLFLGHNFRLKGLWRLLEVLPRVHHRPIHLLAVGRGTGHYQRSRAAHIVRRRGLGDRVTLVGPVARSIDAFAAADALLHLSWHDSFGFAVLEAMACGLPVVTTRHVGAAELIEAGVSGLVVDADDEPAILQAISALSRPDRRLPMGHAAAEIGARHDEATNFRAILTVLETASRRGIGPIAG